VRDDGSTPKKPTKAEIDASDLEKINRAADELNAEAEDAMQYQASWEDDLPSPDE
jgi:hypothetical protein